MPLLVLDVLPLDVLPLDLDVPVVLLLLVSDEDNESELDNVVDEVGTVTKLPDDVLDVVPVLPLLVLDVLSLDVDVPVVLLLLLYVATACSLEKA